ncbi:unnamed protein product [Candida verbasci]|uniref:Zn(2)-C6 fungal-type domain-containing protein n=1 Tax=Candida verbasci TaxID=1227364 RepID=A0A9W4TZE2_9ASCO|nr:unnamed protein product [Candida verbasci]
MDEKQRTKVSKACDYCKKRKFKCSGVAPCDLCFKKNITCSFDIVDKRTIRRKNKKRTPPTTTTTNVKKRSLPKEIQYRFADIKTLKDDIPQEYQTITSFPLNETHEEQPESLSSSDKLPPRMLYDSKGNLRYVGESSPLSFLFDCRNIFHEYIGISEFTSQTSTTLETIDEPDEDHEVVQVALPSRNLLSQILRLFSINVNQAIYLFDMKEFKKTIVDPIYTNYSECKTKQIVLINLVISIGILYAESINDPMLIELQQGMNQIHSHSYFEYGMYLTKKNLTKSKLWITEACALAYVYYQFKSQRNSAWLILGYAIRNAEAIGIHRKFLNDSYKDVEYVKHRRRLFRSLYLMDRISSIILGRPLIIDEKNWDDFDSSDIYDKDANGNIIYDPKYTTVIESCKLCRIGSNIIRSFYLDGSNSAFKAEQLAIEIKIWSLNLPKEIQIDKIVDNSKDIVKGEDYTNIKVSLIMIHTLHLYFTILLFRPFFIHLVFKKQINIKSPTSNYEVAILNFYKSSIKSSILLIQLLEYYYHTFIKDQHNRVEGSGFMYACLSATLVIGLSVLYNESNNFESEFKTISQMNYINSAKNIFKRHSIENPMAEKFFKVVEQMQFALMNKFELDENGNKLDNTPSNSNIIQHKFVNSSSILIDGNSIEFNQEYDRFIESLSNSSVGNESFMGTFNVNDILYNVRNR